MIVMTCTCNTIPADIINEIFLMSPQCSHRNTVVMNIYTELIISLNYTDGLAVIILLLQVYCSCVSLSYKPSVEKQTDITDEKNVYICYAYC